MFCTRCGVEMAETSKYCSQCAHPVGGTVNAQATNVYPPSTWGAPSSLFPPTLTRSLRNRKIAGVCGGIGRHFGLDPTLVRIIFVAAFFCGVLPSLIPYIICWIVMPLEQPEPIVVQPVSTYAPPPAQSFHAMTR